MLKKLSKNEMNYIKGGISAEEYCDTLVDILTNQDNELSQGALEAADAALKEYC